MKSTEQLLREGKQLKTYRRLVGLKQFEAAKMFDTEQGNYCRMEQGRLNSDYRLERLRGMFVKWRAGEVERLKKQIQWLEAL